MQFSTSIRVSILSMDPIQPFSKKFAPTRSLEKQLKDLREHACDPNGGKGGIAFHILTTPEKPIQVPNGTKKSRQGVVTLAVNSSSSIR